MNIDNFISGYINLNKEQLLNEIKNLQNINEIINYKNSLLKLISHFNEQIDNTQKMINIIDKKMENECSHSWQRDYTYYGEHSQYICSICKIYK
jgi:hypothetical protein